MQRSVTKYREHFARMNYLIDGLSDISAFHAYEYQLMVELRNLGYERVLRGDEIFGWSLSAWTLEGAFTLANLHRLRDVPDIAVVVRPMHYAEFCDASDTAVEKALLGTSDLSPNQAKDFFYFKHRLQCYLQTASYYKQVELDQRNPLLDDSILDFLAKVPDELRIDKLLYRRVLNQKYPLLSQFPIAKRSNLEDWRQLLARASPVRAYALDELNDRSSGIWDFLDLAALTNLLGTLEKSFRFRSILAQQLNPKSVVKRSLGVLSPHWLAQIQTQRNNHPVIRLRAERVMLRALVLKNWFDTFV